MPGTMLDNSDFGDPDAYQFRDTVEYDHNDDGIENHVVDATLLGVNGEWLGVYLARQYSSRSYNGHYWSTYRDGEATIVFADKRGNVDESRPHSALNADSLGEYIKQTDWYDLTDDGLVHLAKHTDFGLDEYPEFAEMAKYGKSRRDCLTFAQTKHQLVGVLSNGVGIYYKPYSNHVQAYAYDVEGDLTPVRRYTADLDEYATVDSYFTRMADDDKPGVKETQPVPHPE